MSFPCTQLACLILDKLPPEHCESLNRFSDLNLPPKNWTFPCEVANLGEIKVCLLDACLSNVSQHDCPQQSRPPHQLLNSISLEICQGAEPQDCAQEPAFHILSKSLLCGC